MEAAVNEFLRIIGGDRPEGTLRILGSSSEPERAMSIFEFGFTEALCVVTASRISESAFFGSLRLRVGELSGNSGLTLQRIDDFLAGKFSAFEPRGRVDMEEASEVWIEFDSISSFGDELPATSLEEVVDRLIVFFEEAQHAVSALEEWQQDLGDSLLTCESSTGGKEPLQDPRHWQKYVEERDKDELGLLADREVEKLVFAGRPNLKFHSISEAAEYLGMNYPESLEAECTYEGQTFFLQAAIQRINDKVYGPLFRMTLDIE
jgi:hypothetical protein